MTTAGLFETAESSRKRLKSDNAGAAKSELDVEPIASFVGPAPAPDILCAFCARIQRVTSDGKVTNEPLISCAECGSSGHPSCMRWGRNSRKVAVAKQYKWRCMECKTCEICCSKGEDSEIMFCDRCDRGWHLYCLDPPLSKPPKGQWVCPTCRTLEQHVKGVVSRPNGHAKSHLPDHDNALASTYGAWEHGPNFIRPGSKAGLARSEAATNYPGPMQASSPHPMDVVDEDSPQTVGQARELNASSPVASGRRVRKPTNLDRTFEISTSSISNHVISDSPSVQRKGKAKAPPQQTAGTTVVRLRLNVGANGANGSNSRGVKRGGAGLRSASVNGQKYGRSSAAGPSRRKKTSHSYAEVPIDDESSSDNDSQSTDEDLPRFSNSPAMQSEEEDEEEEDMFGAILDAADADTSQTVPTVEDKSRFQESKKRAEGRLGSVAASLPGSMAARAAARMVPQSAVAVSSPSTAAPEAGTSAVNGLRSSRLASGVSTPSGLPSPSLASSSQLGGGSDETGIAMPIRTVRFGGFDIDTWFQAPYPEEYSLVPDGRLWICEYCLKYMKSGFMATRHGMKCKMRHPPGDEIYRDGNVSIFEVDGRKNKIYCQNLCLLAKMYLDHKTLYYDVEPFLFYVVAEMDEKGAHFVGYFSKEKRSPLNYNVSCIMTLPIRQRRGWGNFIIDISYHLSKKEGKLGSPEKPLSDLGLLSYRNYWTLAVFHFLRVAPDQVTLEDISNGTAMTAEDVFYVLREQDMITLSDGQSGRLRAPATSKYKSRDAGGSASSARGNSRRGRPRGGASASRAQAAHKDKESALAVPTEYRIHFDRDYVVAHLKNYEAKGYLRVRPEKLKWTPFLIARGVADEEEAESVPRASTIAQLIAAAEAVGSPSGVHLGGGGGGGGRNRSAGSSVQLAASESPAPVGDSTKLVTNGADASVAAAAGSAASKTLLHAPEQPDVLIPVHHGDGAPEEDARDDPSATAAQLADSLVAPVAPSQLTSTQLRDVSCAQEMLEHGGVRVEFDSGPNKTEEEALVDEPMPFVGDAGGGGASTSSSADQDVEGQIDLALGGKGGSLKVGDDEMDDADAEGEDEEYDPGEEGEEDAEGEEDEDEYVEEEDEEEDEDDVDAEGEEDEDAQGEDEDGIVWAQA